MSNLTGPAGELHMTIEVTRAATGQTETFQVVGALDADQLKALQQPQDPQETDNGSNS